MGMLTDDQWHDLIIKACDDDGRVEGQWPTIWFARAGLDGIDGSGYLRYYAVLRDAFDVLLGPAAGTVSGSDGGGQSGQWSDDFTHKMALRKQADDDFIRQMHALMLDTGVQVAVMSAYTLTPLLPGYPFPHPHHDPGSPFYAGDPRFINPFRVL